MFKEDADWSDEEEAHNMCKSVLPDSTKTNSNPTAKSKVVGRKSLMRTLQTLGSVPEWKSEDHQQEDSDSDGTPSPCKKKRKKKRNRKRKSAETSEEHQENGEDADKTVEEKNVGPKKRKKDAKFSPLKAQNKSSSEPQGKQSQGSVQVKENNQESTNKLSRQQWKTKMKNKRKNNNKYRQEKPEEEVKKDAAKQETEEDFKTDSNRKTNGEKTSQTTIQKKEVEKKSGLNTKTPESGAEKQQLIRDRNTTKCEKEKKIEAESKNNVIPEQQQKKQKVELSKDQSLKREKLRKLLQGVKTDQQEVPTEQEDKPEEPEAPEVEKVEVDLSDSASLRSRMEQRLESARFRYINEVLYTTSSGEAKRMFTQDPQAFWVYHKGYTAQVQRWPSNPVDDIISFIQQKSSSLVVADFGCGDCKIARGVKNKVHSFDLASTCELVTVCDMAHVPLKDSTVDIAVFCLSLMGTNLAEFIAEANRVLKRGGFLKVAEVASRFEDVRNFVTALSSLGFKLVSKKTDNTHFYSFEFVKTGSPKENIKKFGLQLKPCLYKKR